MAQMIDPALFEQLKGKIEEDDKARDDLNQICQTLEKDVSYAQGVLSRVHSTPRSQCAPAFPRESHQGVSRLV